MDLADTIGGMLARETPGRLHALGATGIGVSGLLALFRAKGFEHVRGGVKGATPYDPDGVKQADRKPLVTNDAVFFPASDLPNRFRIDTIIVGEAYHTDIDEICACVRRAAERKEVLSITSHDIAPDAKHIHMKTAWLEKILATASECGLAVIGFDELPAARIG